MSRSVCRLRRSQRRMLTRAYITCSIRIAQCNKKTRLQVASCPVRIAKARAGRFKI
jgi:hypothetical protein